jgi:aminomethyltransferase
VCLTPLHDVHVELGATFTDFAGWQMPVRYTGDIAEHRAVRQAAGLFDLTHMGEIEVTGPNAAKLLDYALVGHLSALGVGRARYTVGITAFAADSLGDIVYVQLPEVGAAITSEQPCGELESTKSVSDLFAPATGVVLEINTAVAENPELINNDPYDAWLFKVAVASLPVLLSAEEYAALTATTA